MASLKEERSVSVQLIRIVRSNCNVHQKFKKLETITQLEKVRQLEIFGKNDCVVSSRYQLIYQGEPQADTSDVLIPLDKPIVTSRIVLRGYYRKLTIAIYGQEFHDQNIALFFANSIPQAEIDNQIRARSRQVILPNETELQSQLNSVPKVYDQLTEIPKRINERIYKLSNFHLNLDNIQPALLSEDQTQQETQLQIQSLASELQAVDDDYMYIDKKSVALYHEKLEQVGKVLNKHFKKQFAEMHQPAHFDDVGRIYKLLPDNLVDATIFGLKASLSSATRSLTIVNSLLSSKQHAQAFLDKNGLQILLNYLQEKNYMHPWFKIRILETVYNCTNHEEFCVALLTEPTKEKQKSKY